MPEQKIDNLLNLAMDATPQERAKSENLNGAASGRLCSGDFTGVGNQGVFRPGAD